LGDERDEVPHERIKFVLPSALMNSDELCARNVLNVCARIVTGKENPPKRLIVSEVKEDMRRASSPFF